MKREKKICICFTPHRIVVAILLVTSLVNLLIVGAVVEADSTAAPTVIPSQIDQEPTTDRFPDQTLTAFAPTATAWETFTPASDSTQTASPTLSLTPTETATPTATLTSSPTPTACAVKSYWPYLYVQRGDTLYGLARATGSTVDELMQANCLTTTVIHPGQILYVPRLPVPTVTPTATSAPTDFKGPYGEISMCYYPPYISFSVAPVDPEGIKAVTVVYSVDNGPLYSMMMKEDGDTFYASSSLSEKESKAEALYYYFIALDGLGNSTYSLEYKVAASSCPLGG